MKVTAVATGPLVGVNEVTTGVMTKFVLLVAVFPPTVTVIGPVEIPEGTVAVSCVVVAAVTVAVTPLNFTTSCEAVELNPVPWMVTDTAGAPPAGEKLVIAGVTTKLVLLVPVWLLTVTVIVPVVAPLGTVTTSCVVVAEETVAAVPLNLTASLVFVALKLAPVIVTVAPMTPLAGEKLEIVGAVAWARNAVNIRTRKTMVRKQLDEL